MTRLAIFLASFAYSGYSPFAPGTAGSAAALVIFVLIRLSGSPVLEAAVLLAVAVVGTWSASVAERYYHTVDPSRVVIDEVLGMLMTLAFLPVSWTGVAVAFVLFRFLDIVKPYPANVAEDLHGGVGIMADDAVCGVYGNLIMRLAIWLLPAWM